MLTILRGKHHILVLFLYTTLGTGDWEAPVPVFGTRDAIFRIFLTLLVLKQSQIPSTAI